MMHVNFILKLTDDTLSVTVIMILMTNGGHTITFCQSWFVNNTDIGVTLIP